MSRDRLGTASARIPEARTRGTSSAPSKSSSFALQDHLGNAAVAKMIQTSSAHRRSADPLEREADRVASFVEAPGARSPPIDGPLAGPLRAHYESRLGYDLGDVRVHTGTSAAAVARGFDAEAVTIGGDI